MSGWNPGGGRGRLRVLTSQSDGSADLATIDQALAEGRVEDAARAVLAAPLELGPEQTISVLDRVHRSLTGRDPRLRARVGQVLVVHLSRSDETRRALALQEEVMVDAQEADDAWSMTVAEATAALVARRLDEHAATRQLFAAASLRAAGIGPQAAGYVLGMRAQAYLEDGEPEAAAALLREGIALARDSVPAQLLAWAHVLLAQALVLCDRPKDATRELAAALATPHASTELDLLATWLDVHAALAWGRGSRDDAVVALASSDAVRRSIGKVRRSHEDDIVAPVRDAPTGGLALPAAEAAARGRAVLLALAG